jgi:hypothetical protein
VGVVELSWDLDAIDALLRNVRASLPVAHLMRCPVCGRAKRCDAEPLFAAFSGEQWAWDFGTETECPNLDCMASFDPMTGSETMWSFRRRIERECFAAMGIPLSVLQGEDMTIFPVREHRDRVDALRYAMGAWPDPRSRKR